MSRELLSWGRYPRATQDDVAVHWTGDDPFAAARRPVLPYGLGRSYGDVCLNDGGTLLTTRGLDRFVALDGEAGVIECEAGVSLAEILDLIVPRGLFLPVVPGTKQVTVGGAIANDVHGKNHHRAGTFGAHVEALELLRSSGERLICAPDRNPALFRATIGGLGLTGLVLRARLRLRRVHGPWVDQEALPLRGIDHFFEVADASDAANEYTVAWVDCLARGDGVGRGILYRGNFAEDPGAPAPRRRGPRLAVPFELPVSPLNRLTLRAFNAAYHANGRRTAGRRRVHLEPFFFPLDAVSGWNRIYGRAGLLQFQCAVPPAAAPAAIRGMLEAIARAGEGSFLAVLKRFGRVPSPGLLSFPREGVTLALDFPNKGETTARLFRELHAMVAAHQGRIYPAKDAHMSGSQFRAQYADALPDFTQALDPAFSSSFWRRVTTDA